jgi:hypothetical protein
VSGGRDVFEGCLQLQRQRAFRDQLGRFRSDDVDAQQLAVLPVGDHLDHPVRLAGRARSSTGQEREFANQHVVAGLASLLLGQTDRGDFGMGVGAARHHLVVHRRLVPGGILGRHDALVRGQMCQ